MNDVELKELRDRCNAQQRRIENLEGTVEFFKAHVEGLRDRFAMFALSGLLAKEHWTPDDAAVAAYERADAMMTLREKTLPSTVKDK